MFSFESHSYHYPELLQEMALALGTSTKGNRLILPEHFANGYVQSIELPNGLQALISDYSLNDQYFVSRPKIAEEYYILRYEEIEIRDDLTLKIDQEILKTSSDRHAGIYLTSSLFEVSYLGKKGSSLKGINILFNKNWLAQNLHILDPEEVLATYLNLKTRSYTIEPIDSEYRKYFTEIIQADPESPMYMATVQNRIMLLIERFFSRLYEKSQHLMASPKISKHDVQQLMQVEAMLTNDVLSRPPTIEQLAYAATMSTAKLKKLFKEVYGTSIYAYYQKQRMAIARDLLLSGDYSVKEVGLKVGYTNLSNFAAAFRKEFDILPSEIRN